MKYLGYMLLTHIIITSIIFDAAIEKVYIKCGPIPSEIAEELLYDSMLWPYLASAVLFNNNLSVMLIESKCYE